LVSLVFLERWSSDANIALWCSVSSEDEERWKWKEDFEVGLRNYHVHEYVQLRKGSFYLMHPHRIFHRHFCQDITSQWLAISWHSFLYISSFIFHYQTWYLEPHRKHLKRRFCLSTAHSLPLTNHFHVHIIASTLTYSLMSPWSSTSRTFLVRMNHNTF